MADDSTLLITINGKAENAIKAFDDVKAKTEDLQDVLEKVGKVGAIAFAAITGEIGYSIIKYGEQEQATRSLTNAMQNQGIYSKALIDQYGEYAEAVARSAGLETTQVTSAQATIQSMIGQQRVSKELTQATADLAAGMGIGLNEAATLIGKTIGTSVNAFARQGLVMSQTATESERLSKVLDFVNQRYKDSASASAQGVNSAKALKASFVEIEESIGARFAPAFEVAISAMKGMIDYVNDHPFLVDLVAGMLAAGAAIAALTVAIPALAVGFLTLSAAATALGVSTAVLSATFLIIPTAIALVVAAGVALYKNWGDVRTFGIASFGALATFLQEVCSGIAKYISGAMTLDKSKIDAGIEQVEGAYKKSSEKFKAIEADNTTAVQQEADKQDAVKKAAADKVAARARQEQSDRLALSKNESEALKLTVESGSEDVIAIKKQEASVLKELATQKSAVDEQTLRESLSLLQAMEVDAKNQAIKRDIDFENQRMEVQRQFGQEGISLQSDLSAQQQQAVQKNLETQKQAEQKVATDRLNILVQEQNKYKESVIKFGPQIAAVEKVLYDVRVTNAKAAADNLVDLENSKNATLKGIGKAAALTQTALSTAQAAINVFEGFSTIPIVGYGLGLAAAAAVIAYGAEREGDILAAADGGIMTGGIPGVDSIPTLTMPGELVTPTKNFDEVVGAVATSRAGGADQSDVVGKLSEISGKLDQQKGNQVIVQGDVLSDDAFIQRIGKSLSDAIQFKNLRFYGVNA